MADLSSHPRRVPRARISLAALRHNLAVIRRAAPDSRVMAVVKANAYGHGSVMATRALADADSFAVARLDEALELRRAGVAHPIVLLEGVLDAQQLQQGAQAELELVVHNADQIALLEQAAPTQALLLWLKLNTGMNRLGFEPADAVAAWRRLSALPRAPRELRLMTHLACADEPGAKLTIHQLAQFRDITASLRAVTMRDPVTSIGSSAGIFSSRDRHGDWVRPGIALYGASPFSMRSADDLGLRAVMNFESVVIAVHDLTAGASVGYGATWRATGATRIAIVAAGYADGVPRHLSNGAPILVNGRRAALVGRVSMDMFAADVTGIADVRAGSTVTLWGAGLPADDVARAAGTIAYELFSRIGRRVALEPETDSARQP